MTTLEQRSEPPVVPDETDERAEALRRLEFWKRPITEADIDAEVRRLRR